MNPNNLTKLDVERLIAGEFQGKDLEEIKNAVNQNKEMQAYYSSLQEHKKEFLEAHPVPDWVKQHSKQAEMVPKESVTLLDKITDILQNLGRRPAFATGLVAVILVVVMFPIIFQDSSKGPEEHKFNTRTKGSLELKFRYKRGEQIFPGNINQNYREGDEIQFLYTAKQFSHLSLISIDSRKKISVYSKPRPNSIISVSAKKGAEVAYPHSVILDDAKGKELFVAVFSSKALSKSDVIQQLNLSNLNKYPSTNHIQKSIESFTKSKNVGIVTLMLGKE